jgi:hypothetical protein
MINCIIVGITLTGCEGCCLSYTGLKSPYRDVILASENCSITLDLEELSAFFLITNCTECLASCYAMEPLSLGVA